MKATAATRKYAVVGLLIAMLALCAVAFCPARAQAWTVTSADLSDTERQVAQSLLDGGLDEMHAAAIMGNIRQESAFNASDIQISHNCLAPSSYANCRGGHGLFQLEADDRFQGLNNYAVAHGSTWRDASMQIGYMFSEADYIFRTFSTAYYVYADHGYSGDGIRGVGYLMTFSDWCAISDLDWAVQSFEQIYEGASMPRMSTRISYARNYYRILMADKPLVDDTVRGSTSTSTVGGVKVLMRYAGDTRYDTSNLINADVSAAGRYGGVIIASGENGKFADALCASGLSSVLGYPIVLINGSANALNATTRDAIVSLTGSDRTDIIVLGGTSTINEGLGYALSVFDSDGNVTRISGDDRYATAAAIYDYGASHGGWSTTYAVVAKGNDFPDALGAASFCAAMRSPMLLSDANSASLEGYITTAASVASNVVIVGGAASVSDGKASEIAGRAAVERVNGANRYETNVNLASWQISHGMSASGIGVATGASFPDALGSSYLLSITDSVLVLASPSGAENTALYNFLGTHKDDIALVKVFGGTSSVSADIQNAIVDALLW